MPDQKMANRLSVSSRDYRGRSEKDIHVQNRMRSGGSGGAGLDNHAAGGRLGT